jgi:ribosome-associated protein
MIQDAPAEQTIRINEDVAIPLTELKFQFARSSGPGGQHVNKSETRVELLFDLEHSPSLTLPQKALARRRLGNRVDSRGVLHVVSSDTRSQLQNREDATMRFVVLMSRALSAPRPRRKTLPPRVSLEQRLEEKRRRSETKRLRRGEE